MRNQITSPQMSCAAYPKAYTNGPREPLNEQEVFVKRPRASVKKFSRLLNVTNVAGALFTRKCEPMFAFRKCNLR